MRALTIGSDVHNPTIPVSLDAERFNRHTFWCGQSGSGKTYALGVVLEQLLLRTELPLLILDPNADFVRMHTVRDSVGPDVRERLRNLEVRVFRSGAGASADDRLHARWVNLSTAAKAAVLQMDPIADAEEFNVLLHVDAGADAATFDAGAMVRALRGSGDPAQARLANRMENLQVLEWELWARGQAAVTDTVEARPRATVLDLGGFEHPAEPKVAALAVLEHLWAQRESRKPVLIVIDEAHNICPPAPVTAVERALTERVIQIAAEGRKFGLWLFLSTQRPTKIHPNVLSQCDNLGVMRMNSPRDLAELADVFGFVPEDQIRSSQSFRQGQAVFAGGFITQPTVVQMGDRLTHEAGGDVAVPVPADGL
ncbi:ATP-binding protein [Microbacterium sp. Leaf320]|uniref:ATP-binding protein n=1 Tax=Microbacterium sp. Leaf320 TaxID=1736334 RepID=UPI0006F8FDF6|nr:ATP-binding protein [Microbacterium sp. Leaf320]KQQ65343.1 ATPase [Microbacterium sp. Leaf320]